MPKYRLKPGVENFTVMSGPDAGKSFVRGREYDQVPAGYEKEDRFEAIGGEIKPETGTRPDNSEPGVQMPPADLPPVGKNIPEPQVNTGKKQKTISRGQTQINADKK